MRALALATALLLALSLPAAEVESRVLTHYVPQDYLESMVRTEHWKELPLPVTGGVRKDDTVRIWAGGTIDYGNGDQPGEHITTPAGPGWTISPAQARNLALSQRPADAFAVLVKTETPGIRKCPAKGKPLEIRLTKDREKVWIGFNDLRGLYRDNHLGKGGRHELEPMWLRIEVVRTIVD